MLVTKDNNSSAQLIPLTTSFAMFRDSKGFNGEATMSLQPLASTEKIFFPGCDALTVCQHQTYNTETHDFSGINQAISSRAGGFNIGAGWGRDVDLTARLFDTGWYKNFNRVSNWCDFSTYSANESANYYSVATAEALMLEIPYVHTKYDATIHHVRLDITGNTDAIVSVWNNSKDITIDINPLETYQDVHDMCYVNCSAYNNERRQETTASQYYMLPAMLIFSISSYTALYDFINKSHAITSRNYNKLNIQPYPLASEYKYSCVVNERLYFSAFTASIKDYNLDNPPLTLTGDDLFFNFNTTGTGVTGTVMKLQDNTVSANVTADVDYIKIVNSVTSTDVSEYKWSNTTGRVYPVGGGGSYSISVGVYPPHANKNIVNPTDISKVVAYDDYKVFTLSSKNNIPDTYGGAILFSGDNISRYFNQNDKFYCVGIKGVSYNFDYAAHTTELSDNFEGKLYKFNDEHFKKINDDTFIFFDDAISKIYTCTENSYTSGANIRKFAPIGPFFCEYSGYTRINSAGISYDTFSVTLDDLYDIPTVLHTMSYIHSFDPVKNTNQKYIIAKPAGAISYNSDGFDKNHGNTETYSYLAMQLPTYVVASSPLVFNSNITEITQLGDSVRAFTAMYSDSTRLTALSAIKSNFYNCMNIEQADDLFSGASALVEVPRDFNNFNRLYRAPSMFSDCVSLTALPDFYGLYSLQYCPQMFSNCNKVINMPLGTLTALTTAQAMFENCSSMSGNKYNKMIPPTNWKSFAPNLEYADAMFANCVKITDIQTDLSAANIRSMKDMFKNCSAITSDIGPILDFVRTRFYPGQATAFSGAFSGCTAVHSGVSSYNDIIHDVTPAYAGGPTRADVWWKPLFGIIT